MACKKEITSQNQTHDPLDVAATSIPSLGSQQQCREELQPDWIADTAEVPTHLGATLIGNPFSVVVMQQAATNLYGNTRYCGK